MNMDIKNNCCAMRWDGKKFQSIQCSRNSSKTVSTVGPVGETIERNVCDQHFGTATWDRENGGHWGLRVRLAKGEGGSDFHGFVGEPPVNLRYLRKTQSQLEVGKPLSKGGKAKVMRLHHQCPITKNLFYLIHWKAPHDDYPERS
jgi:hypothetical protein